MSPERDDFARSVRGFKILSIVGCVGTLAFLFLEARRENVAAEWRGWQARYADALPPELAEAFEVGPKQAFVPDLGRVDRCQSCHVGIDDPAMSDAEQPLRSHPGDLLAAHPVEDFGCTICHQGQGRMMDAEAAHGEVPHWEEPLLRGDLVYTSCGKCHAESAPFGHARELYGADSGAVEILEEDLAASLPGARLLARGKELFVGSGCLGCHTFRGVGGSLGPDLTTVGDKGLHGYDYSHLPHGVERTPLDWLIAHFMDPGALSPGTVMPEIGASEEEARALAALMLSMKSRDVPSRYRVAPASVLSGGGRPASGERLYQLFCIACHGADLAGSDVPAIRTPSLSNEGFLSVASEDFLHAIVSSGRGGTAMPGWGQGAGGLSRAQIAQLVDYIRSFAPNRADVAAVSSAEGVAEYGRALYRGSCAACHGLDGEGGVGTRLSSGDFLALASDRFLARVIVEGRPETGMPSWGGFTTQEVSDLLAHLRRWGDARSTGGEALVYLEQGGDAVMGGRLYRSRCADCHGRGGEGGIGPSLNHDEFLSIVSDGYLVHAILGGRPGTAMPAWLDLFPEDVGDLVAYLRDFSDAEPVPPSGPLAQGDPEHGRMIYDRTCASCHGREAVGGTGPQLRNPVFLEHASDGFLYHTIARGRPGTPMRGFYREQGIADLTEAQITDVVAWLRSLEHAGPAAVDPRPVLGSVARGKELYDEVARCAGCHGPNGEGVLGPALGNPAFLRQAGEGFLVATLVLGRDGTEMRSFGSNGIVRLTPEEIMDVTAYVQSLGVEHEGGRRSWRRFQVTRDQVDLGAELFRDYCSSCHGPDGRSGYAPELNNPEFLAAASDGFLVATIARGRESTPMRPFGPGHSGLAALSHQELVALVGFIRSWDPTPWNGLGSAVQDEDIPFLETETD